MFIPPPAQTLSLPPPIGLPKRCLAIATWLRQPSLTRRVHQQVLSRGSDAELTAFASRILDSEELRVEESQHFADFSPSLRNSRIAMPFAAFE